MCSPSDNRLLSDVGIISKYCGEDNIAGHVGSGMFHSARPSVSEGPITPLSC